MHSGESCKGFGWILIPFTFVRQELQQWLDWLIFLQTQNLIPEIGAVFRSILSVPNHFQLHHQNAKLAFHPATEPYIAWLWHGLVFCHGSCTCVCLSCRLVVYILRLCQDLRNVRIGNTLSKRSKVQGNPPTSITRKCLNSWKKGKGAYTWGIARSRNQKTLHPQVCTSWAKTSHHSAWIEVQKQHLWQCFSTSCLVALDILNHFKSSFKPRML